MKKPAQVYDTQPSQNRGCGISLGCFGIGCLIIVAGVIGLMGLAWYGMMHTALPLRILAQSLEADGNIEIDGLEGNLSQGITVQTLRFKSFEDQWSELNGISFSYRGLNFSGNAAIESVNIDSATIMADVSPPADIWINPLAVLSWTEIEADTDARSYSTGEMQINDVKIGAINLVNPQTQFKISLDRIKYGGFRMRGTRLLNPGTLDIHSDLLQVVTEVSPRWPDYPESKRFVGTLPKEFFTSLKDDLAIQWDVQAGVAGFSCELETFGGKVTWSKGPKRSELRFIDFNPYDFFEGSRIEPTSVQLSAHYRPINRRRGRWIIDSGGHFNVGQTRFDIKPDAELMGNRVLIGNSEIQGQSLRLVVTCQDIFSPTGLLLFDSNEQPADKELWAQVVYSRPFSELTADQSDTIASLISASKGEMATPRTSNSATTPEQPADQVADPAEADPDKK